MERPVAQLASNRSDRETAECSEAADRVVALLRVLGLREPQQLQALAEQCVQRARLRVRERSSDELNRRALEEARRHHDRWLARSLGRPQSPSPQDLGRVRTALLLAHPEIGKHYGGELGETETRALRGAFPQPTPPEAPLAMSIQRIEFVAMATAGGEEHQ